MHSTQPEPLVARCENAHRYPPGCTIARYEPLPPARHSGFPIHHARRCTPAEGRAGSAVAGGEAPGYCCVAAAAAQGDRSENAEYTYGKKRLREIDARVRFLRRRLDGMKVVDQPPADRGRVFFGAWVTLRSDDRARLSAIASSARRIRHCATATSAWTRRWRAPCWARRWTRRSARELGGRETRYEITAIDYETMTRSPVTFLNCHGSLMSRSSGNSRSRSDNGDQSVYAPGERAEIGPADLQDAPVVELVRLDQPARGFSIAQIMPASTETVTCRLVALL